MGIGTINYKPRRPRWFSDWNYTRGPWWGYALSAVVLVVTAPLWLAVAAVRVLSVVAAIGPFVYVPAMALWHLLA